MDFKTLFRSGAACSCELAAASRIRYETSFESFEQNAQTVLAEILDKKTERKESISADYLVGCDGGRSSIRRALDIKYHRGVLTRDERRGIVSLTDSATHQPWCGSAISDHQRADQRRHRRRRR